MNEIRSSKFNVMDRATPSESVFPQNIHGEGNSAIAYH